MSAYNDESVVGAVGSLLIVLALFESFCYYLLHIHGMYIIEAALLLFVIAFGQSDGLFKGVWKDRVVALWGVWCIYSLINWAFKGILNPEAGIPFYVFGYILLPWSIMAIVYYKGIRNIYYTLKLLLWVLAIYVLGGIILQAGGSGGLSFDSRGGMELGNTLPLTAVVLVFVAYMAHAHRVISIKILIALAVLSLAAIFYVSTRKAMGAWGIITLFFVLGKYGFKKIGDFLILLFFAAALYLGYTFAMDNTLMGERMDSIEDIGLRYVDGENSLLRFLGDRAFFYVTGWEVFLEHPISGIGLTNFPMVTNTTLVLHTEYMVQLCECGIIGTVIFLLFQIGIIRLLLRAKQYVQREIRYICWGGYLSILFIDLTAWTYSAVRYFVIYGLILACCRGIEYYNCGNQDTQIS